MLSERGKLTTEYERTKSSGLIGTLLVLLGAITTLGPQLIAQFGGGEGSMITVIAGAAIAVAGAVLKGLTDLGYTKSRTDVKVAESMSEYAKDE